MKITVNESQASAYKVADDLAEEVRIELKDLLLDESDVEDAFKDVATPIIKDAFGGKREYANVQLWPSDDPDDIPSIFMSRTETSTSCLPMANSMGSTMVTMVCSA